MSKNSTCELVYVFPADTAAVGAKYCQKGRELPVTAILPVAEKEAEAR